MKKLSQPTSIPERPVFRGCDVEELWLVPGYRRNLPHLRLEAAHGSVAKALEFFHGQRVWVGDYVVMPNHVHVLAQPFPGVALEDWLYSIKRFTSTELGKDAALSDRLATRQGHLWQTESFDRIVRGVEELGRTRRYIANNPAKLRPGTFALKQIEWLDEFAPRSSSTFQCRVEGQRA